MVDPIQGPPGERGPQGEQGVPGTSPNTDPLVEAIVELTESNREAKRTNIDLVNAVRRESDLRTEKIHSIEKTNSRIDKLIKFLVAGIVCLLLLAGINVYNTTIAQRAANQVKATNELLVSCFDPTSECGKRSAAEQARQRQQAFVIASCQRQNPVDLEATPAQNEKALLDCIKEYYPDLQLPPKAGG